MKELLFHLNR